jgi:hypothetical protein
LAMLAQETVICKFNKRRFQLLSLTPVSLRCSITKKKKKIKMPLSEFEKERVERIFSAYCAMKAPHHISDQFRVEFELRGEEVKLFESRPFPLDKSQWISHKIARFKKDRESNCWCLYYADRNERWHSFEPYPSDKDIEKLLAEVEKDMSGIFWG